jgi:hypothetical protein
MKRERADVVVQRARSQLGTSHGNVDRSEVWKCEVVWSICWQAQITFSDSSR